MAKISKTNHRGCIFVFIIYDNDLKKLHHLSSVENFVELLPKKQIFFLFVPVLVPEVLSGTKVQAGTKVQVQTRVYTSYMYAFHP